MMAFLLLGCCSRLFITSIFVDYFYVLVGRSAETHSLKHIILNLETIKIWLSEQVMDLTNRYRTE